MHLLPFTQTRDSDAQGGDRKILDHTIIVRQPIQFFILLPLKLQSEALSLVINELRVLLHCNRYLCALLNNSFVMQSLPSPHHLDVDNDLHHHVQQVARLIDQEITEVVKAWLQAERPDVIDGVIRERESLQAASPDEQPMISSLRVDTSQEEGNRFTVELTKCSAYGLPTLQATVTSEPLQASQDAISSITVPPDTYQTLLKLRSDMLLRVFYCLYIHRNIVVFSNNVYKLASIFNAFRMMVRIMGIKYYGIPYYTESLFLHHDFLLQTAEAGESSFFACVYSSGSIVKKCRFSPWVTRRVTSMPYFMVWDADDNAMYSSGVKLVDTGACEIPI